MEVVFYLYLHLSLPLLFQMLQEDHQCIHPCQFRTYYVEEDVVVEFHVLEVVHVSSHVVHHA